MSSKHWTKAAKLGSVSKTCCIEACRSSPIRVGSSYDIQVAPNESSSGTVFTNSICIPLTSVNVSQTGQLTLFVVNWYGKHVTVEIRGKFKLVEHVTFASLKQIQWKRAEKAMVPAVRPSGLRQSDVVLISGCLNVKIGTVCWMSL